MYFLREPIDEWVYLFKNSRVRAEFHSKNIKAAQEKLDVLHMSHEERQAYTAYRRSRTNTFEIFEAKYTQGKEDEKRENARRMQAKGFDVATIREITGLTEQELACPVIDPNRSCAAAQPSQWQGDFR